MTPADSNSTTTSPHLDFLRGQVRAALLTKKRGEARHILGQLISLSDDSDAVENLQTLVGGVLSEVAAFESRAGLIHDRLAAGGTTSEIQLDLDSQIPYWRAFTADIPVLLLAKNGLSDYDNPIIKAKLMTLPDHIKAGRMDEALQLWKDLGEPTGAVNGILVQTLQFLCKIRDNIEKQNWSSALSSLKGLLQLRKTSNLTDYDPGLRDYIALHERNLGYELLLNRADDCGTGKRVRKAMMEELFSAKTEIEARTASDLLLIPYKERVDEAIDQLDARASDEATSEPSGGFRIVLPLVIVLIACGLIGIWAAGRNGPTLTNGSKDSQVSPESFDNSACGERLDGDIVLGMPNTYLMIFRKVYLSDSPGMDGLKIMELDGEASTVRAPFLDQSGRRYFLMGRTEVSAGQYSQFMPLDASIKGQPALPVRRVTANEAEAFCLKYSMWLKDHEKLPQTPSGKYGQARLPSNAEWEFTARGGHPDSAEWLERFGAYPAGSISQYEWFDGPQSSQGSVRKIALLAPNKLGIFDMLGNVNEIVTSNRTDQRKHWMRGGNITNSESSLTPALKQPMPDLMPSVPSPFRQEALGFRIVISAAPEWSDSQQ